MDVPGKDDWHDVEDDVVQEHEDRVVGAERVHVDTESFDLVVPEFLDGKTLEDTNDDA